MGLGDWWVGVVGLCGICLREGRRGGAVTLTLDRRLLTLRLIRTRADWFRILMMLPVE